MTTPLPGERRRSSRRPSVWKNGARTKTGPTLQVVVPLATPRGRETPKCKVCKSQARLCCANCYTNYCTRDHFYMDRLHTFLCDYLKDVGELSQYVLMSEERDRRKRLLDFKQTQTAQRTQEMAVRFLSEGDPSQALLSASFSLNIMQKVLGPDHDETILVHLLVTACYMAQRKLNRARNTLTQVSHHVLSKPITSGLVLGEYSKTNGLLAVEENKPEEAIYHFSDEVYHISQHFTTNHHRTGVSLWRLGQAFLRVAKYSTANSMYKQAVDIWQKYLDERLKVGEEQEEEAERAVVSIASDKREGLLDVRSISDGAAMLHDILKSREQNPKLDGTVEDLLQITYVYAMYHFANEDYEEAFQLLTKCTEDLLSKVKISEELRDAIVTLFKRSRRKRHVSKN